MRSVIVFGISGCGTSTVVNFLMKGLYSKTFGGFSTVSTTKKNLTHRSDELECVEIKEFGYTDDYKKTIRPYLKNADEIYIVGCLDSGRLRGSFADFVNKIICGMLSEFKTPKQYSIIFNRYPENDIHNFGKYEEGLISYFGKIREESSGLEKIFPPKNIILIPEIEKMSRESNVVMIGTEEKLTDISFVIRPVDIIFPRFDHKYIHEIILKTEKRLFSELLEHVDIYDIFQIKIGDECLLDILIRTEKWETILILARSGARIDVSTFESSQFKFWYETMNSESFIIYDNSSKEKSYDDCIYQENSCVWYSMEMIKKKMKFIPTMFISEEYFNGLIEKHKKHHISIRHPYLIRCFDIIKDEKIIEPHICRLNEYKEEMTVKQKSEFVKHLCIGLQYLHFNGISHGDICPNTIKLTKIGDNIVLKIDNFGMITSFLCTIPNTKWRPENRYRAPEFYQERLETVNRRKSDIYSLGAVIVYIYTGMHVFTEKYKTSRFQIFGDKGDAYDEKIDLLPEYELSKMKEICGDTEFYNLIKNCFSTNAERRPSLKDILLTLMTETEYEEVRKLNTVFQ